MMEEVSDDTNGESTFEFVGGKSDESILKDVLQDSNKEAEPHSSECSPVQFYQPSNTLPPQYSTSNASHTESANKYIAEKESCIPFYDPAQYLDSNTLLMSPLPMTPLPVHSDVSLSSPVATSAQMQYAAMQQSPPITAATSQVPQPLPVLSQTFVEANAPHCAVPLPGNDDRSNMIPYQESGTESGVWGWIKNAQFLNKVAEKAKSSVDSVITTLDPGMKEIINTGGDISVVVASGNETKVSAVREAFQLVFGKAVVQGMAVQASSIAPQPVGFSAGLKAAEERINNLRQQGFLQDHHVILAIENFIAELTPENWFDIGCLFLQDYASGISLRVYTQAIPISSHFVSQAKDQTPADYPLGWSGHAVTIGQIIGAALGVPHSEWHQALTGVSRREILFLAAKTMAGLYKAQLKR